MDMILNSKKQALVKVLALCVCFFIMLLLSYAQIYQMRPFATGFFVALVFCSLPLLVVVPMYLICELIAGGHLHLFCAIIVCFEVVIIYYAFKNAPAKYKTILIVVSALLSCIGVAVMSNFIGYEIFSIVVYAISAVLFALCSYYICVPIIKEKLQYKLLEVELICLGVFTIVLSYSLSSFFISIVPLVLVFFGFVFFISAKIAGFKTSIIVALCFGCGVAVSYNSVDYIALYAIIAITSAIFVTAPKIIMPLGAIMGYILATFFFYQEFSDVLGSVIALAVGGVLYMCVPFSFINNVRNHIFISHERVAVRYMINKMRNDTGIMLRQSANIFSLMGQNILKVEDASNDFSDSIVNKCCCICSNYDRCRGHFHSEAIATLTQEVLRTGHVSIGVLPQFLCDNCLYLAKLMQVAGGVGDQYRKLKAKMDAQVSARGIVSESMTGASNLLQQLAGQCTAYFDSEQEREKMLLSELNYLSVMTAECIILGSEICLIIKTDSFDRAIIEKATKRIMKKTYKIVRTSDTIMSGFCAVNLNPQSNYNVVFAHASAPKIKGQTSGDTHTFVKLSNNRFLLSLCDGMGSGEKAQRASDSAISLVENFYKAGYSHDLVLKSVNKYLSLCGSERFSALDICVIDLDQARADIIKLGSPSTYIKMKDSVAKIDSTSAPLGAVENLTHNIVSVALSVGDSIVLVSDGVSDSFDGDKLSSAINNIRTTNPQIIAQSVLEMTYSNCGKMLKDDTSVVVARIITI